MLAARKGSSAARFQEPACTNLPRALGQPAPESRVVNHPGLAACGGARSLELCSALRLTGQLISQSGPLATQLSRVTVFGGSRLVPAMVFRGTHNGPRRAHSPESMSPSAMTRAFKQPSSNAADSPPAAQPEVGDRFPAGVRVRRAPLTAEHEWELARRMERARRAIAEAVAHSTTAARELSSMAAAVLAGELGAHELLAEPEGIPPDALRHSLAALEHLDRARRHRRAPDGQDSVAETLLQLLLRHRLSEAALDRIVSRLVAPADREAERVPRAARRTAAAVARARAALASARTTFVEANIGLVVSMATRKAQLGLPLLDLIQEGCMGILKATEKFDYRRGLRFSTYAGWWVRHALNRALSDQGRTIRMPVHFLEKQYRLRQHERELGLELGRKPTDAEVAARARLSIEELHAIQSVPRHTLSLDVPVATDTDATWSDFLADRDTPSALDQASSKHLGERLRELIHTLSPREQDVLRWRFGIDSAGTLTLKEIGDRFSVSRERVRQIEAEALAKLRAQAASEDLDSLLS